MLTSSSQLEVNPEVHPALGKNVAFATVSHGKFSLLDFTTRDCISTVTEAITINRLQSQHAPLYYGVPLGSVLSPLLFILFDLVRKHTVSHRAFTDVRQLYKICTPVSRNHSELHYRCQVLHDHKPTR